VISAVACGYVLNSNSSEPFFA